MKLQVNDVLGLEIVEVKEDGWAYVSAAACASLVALIVFGPIVYAFM